mmetsp:Transcript_45026/g.101276  ORF Transcript_45026/g.101276 Transcript_45026/m.101276 type:complete len:276 (-) Transcript_45026:77-904(-)
MLSYTMAALADEGGPSLIISEKAMAPRPAPPAMVISCSQSMELGLEQQKALARVADYPRRVARLKWLWMDDPRAADRGHKASRPCSGASLCSRSSSQPANSRFPRCTDAGRSRLASAGASAVGAGRYYTERRSRSHHSSHSHSCHARHKCGKKRRAGREDPHIGPLTAAQIRELMSRDLTPEDYELLLLLDEGVKKAQTLPAGVASMLSRASGSSWIGEECRICLCALEEGEDVRTLPRCGHAYHAPCVERWLSESKASCPVCGTEVVLPIGRQA